VVPSLCSEKNLETGQCICPDRTNFGALWKKEVNLDRITTKLVAIATRSAQLDPRFANQLSAPEASKPWNVEVLESRFGTPS
jgi:hypothetical protein